MQFNDIRTTLQALCAITDHCNSLHTNAFDEALTTPTEESVRRALAVELIVQREWGLSRCENALQGSFVVEQLTDSVEAAVLEEFQRLSRRGGVLGAMETGYQRAKIQEESMRYEMGKNNGSLPIIGVNTFTRDEEQVQGLSLPVPARSTDEEKETQLTRLAAFHDTHKMEAPEALHRLRQVARSGGNIFAELMNTVRGCSLGQITETLFSVGGTYRRQM
jgi:methylmalonyl-CoA mutase